MPIAVGPEAGPVEDVNSSLEAGLKSCRAVVNNYRQLLNGEPPSWLAAAELAQEQPAMFADSADSSQPDI